VKFKKGDVVTFSDWMEGDTAGVIIKGGRNPTVQFEGDRKLTAPSFRFKLKVVEEDQ